MASALATDLGARRKQFQIQELVLVRLLSPTFARLRVFHQENVANDNMLVRGTDARTNLLATRFHI